MSRSPDEKVAGPIWLATSTGDAFPEAGWCDFPAAVLGAWIPSLRHLSARGRAAECQFIEGPYHFTVGTTEDGRWRISCFERRLPPSVANAAAEWTVDADQFLTSALAAARVVLGFCDSRGWWSEDTERLRSAMALADPAAGA